MKNSGIEWIGEIPDDWEVERLQWYIEEVKVSNNPMQTDCVLSLTNKAGVIPYEEKGAQGNVAKEDYTQYKLAYPHTIVANSMNILIGSVGICNYFGCVSPVYYVFKPTDKADLFYINYIMQTVPFQKELRRYANGILEIRLRVSANGILKRKIAIPSLDQQKSIVAEINKKCMAIDSMVANQQAQIEKLKEYKQSVITEAVTKGLDPSVPMKPSGVEWIGEVPNSWQIIRGKNIFKQRNEKGNTKCIQLLSPTQHYGVIPQELYDQISGMTAVKLNLNVDLSTMKTIHNRDYCISLRSFQGGFEYSTYEGVVSPAYQVFYAFVRINEKYYKYLFKEKGFISEMNSFTLTIRDGKNISFGDFANSEIPYPPIDDQQQIADHLDKKCAEIDKLISVKQQKIEKLNEYKKSLIYEYVTGKKEVW